MFLDCGEWFFKKIPDVPSSKNYRSSYFKSDFVLLEWLNRMFSNFWSVKIMPLKQCSGECRFWGRSLRKISDVPLCKIYRSSYFMFSGLIVTKSRVFSLLMCQNYVSPAKKRIFRRKVWWENFEKKILDVPPGKTYRSDYWRETTRLPFRY